MESYAAQVAANSLNLNDLSTSAFQVLGLQPCQEASCLVFVFVVLESKPELFNLLKIYRPPSCSPSPKPPFLNQVLTVCSDWL